MRTSKISGIFLIVIIMLLGITGYKSLTTLTYLEYEIQNEQGDSYIHLQTTGDVLLQDFYSPYDIMHGISLKTETYSRDNNSIWNIALVDKETGVVLYNESYNASLIIDNNFHIFEFKKNILVKKDKVYQIRIMAENVNENTSIAFYQLSETTDDKLNLYWNGEKTGGTICFAIYGGDVDYWWLRYTVVLAVLAVILLFRGSALRNRGLKVLEDKIFMSIIIGGIVLSLLCSFSILEGFTDEYDNIRGGMIIANGGVLYRDYVTQHPPVAYYLCSIFALLGAGSVVQFRLSYYFVEAVVWGLLYYRHADYFNRKKFIWLPIAECIFISAYIPHGFQILSDGIQGLCMVALMLEFIRYFADKKLGWDRSVIISVCIWGSFAAAFLSIYALFWIVLIVLAIEIYNWTKSKVTFKAIVNRYFKLVIAVMFPLICAIVYFEANYSLHRAYEQLYIFNREVYPEYISGFGSNVLQPLISAVQNFCNIIADSFNKILTGMASTRIILQLLVVTWATAAIIIIIMKRRYIEAFGLFTVMCCSATRGYDNFHGLAAWYIAIMIIVIFSEELKGNMSKINVPCAGIIVIFLFRDYFNVVGDNLLYKQSSVTEIESRVVSITEVDENILMDACCCDSIYFLYKDRYPINRAVYMLPWYMDWYEQDTIDDLYDSMPRIVVYDEEMNIWGYTHYSNSFAIELKKNYIRFSENPDSGWLYRIWIRNN